MARAYVELPQGWGPGRLVTVAVERLGYATERHVSMATGRARLVVDARPGSLSTSADHRD